MKPFPTTQSLAATLVAVPLICAAELPESTLLTGDKIIMKGAGDKFIPVLEDEKKANASKFAPPRTKLKVVNDIGANNARKLTVVIEDVPCADDDVAVTSKAAQMISTITVAKGDCANQSKVVEGHNYTILKDEIDNFGYRRLGWIYGGLIIPYKYFRHDKSLEPGTTIGPFVGYRFGQTGWGVSVVGTYAITTIKLKVVDGTELKDRTFTGISRGIGLFFDLAKSETPFRFGAMWGKDRVGSNNVDVYPHEGKSWFALQLGWEFGR